MRGKSEGRKKQASAWLTEEEHAALIEYRDRMRSELAYKELSVSDLLRTQFILPVLNINGHLE